MEPKLCIVCLHEIPKNQRGEDVVTCCKQCLETFIRVDEFILKEEDKIARGDKEWPWLKQVNAKPQLFKRKE